MSTTLSMLAALLTSPVGNGGILAFGKTLAFGAMVAWANGLKKQYDWFKACQAATQFIASNAGLWFKACQPATQFKASSADVYEIC